MADVPYGHTSSASPYPTVEPSTAGVNLNVPVGAFGGLMAQTLSRNATAYGQAGREQASAMDFAARQQGEAGRRLSEGLGDFGQGAIRASDVFGQVAADDATNHVINESTKILYGDPSRTGPDGQPDTGFFGLTGRAALDQRAAVLDQINGLISDTRGNLGSLKQTTTFDAQTRRLYQMTMERVSSHADSQAKTWAVKVNNDAATTATSAIAASWETDQSMSNLAWQQLRSARVKQAMLNGTPVEDAVRQADQEAIHTIALAMSVRYPGRAQDFIEQHRADLGTAYQPLADHLRTRVSDLNVRTTVGGIVDEVRNNYSAGRPVVPGTGAGTITPAPPGEWQGIGTARPVMVSADRRTAYDQVVTDNATRTGVPAPLIHAVIGAESSGNPTAVGPVTREGWRARGLMQLSPRNDVTDYNDVRQNVRSGTDELAADLRRFGNIPHALAAYNWGPNATADWVATGADPAKLPRETRDYIASVTSDPAVKGLMAGSQSSAQNLTIDNTKLNPDIGTARDPAAIKRIVVHGTDPRMSTENMLNYLGKPDASRGFTPDYHYFVTREGHVYQLAPDNRVVSHIKGQNADTIGVSLEGADSGEVTDTQRTTALSLISSLGQRYGIDPQNVQGHGELQPDRREPSEGGDIPRLIRERGYVGGPTTTPVTPASQPGQAAAIAVVTPRPATYPAALRANLEDIVEAAATRAEAQGLSPAEVDRVRSGVRGQVSSQIIQMERSFNVDTDEVYRAVNNAAAQGNAPVSLEDLGRGNPTLAGTLTRINQQQPRAIETLRSYVEAVQRQLVTGHRETGPGPGFYDLLQKIHPADGSRPTVTDPDQLSQYLDQHRPDHLTYEGFDRLRAEVAGGRKDPQRPFQADLERAALAYAKHQLTFEADYGVVKIPDPHGTDIFNSRFIPMFYQRLEAGLKDGTPIYDLLTQGSKSYIPDQLIQSLRRSDAELARDRNAASVDAKTDTTLNTPTPATPATNPTARDAQATLGTLRTGYGDVKNPADLQRAQAAIAAAYKAGQISYDAARTELLNIGTPSAVTAGPPPASATPPVTVPPTTVPPPSPATSRGPAELEQIW